MIDIYQKIEYDFGDKAVAVHTSLKQLQTLSKRGINNRVIRAILYLADGDLPTFHLKIKQAKIDWRDILMQAEYNDSATKRERDFNKTFFELGIIENNH